MFLNLRNLNKRLTKFTFTQFKNVKLQKFSDNLDSIMDSIPKRKQFMPESDLNKFFSEHEQYIANFYRKHKENILFKELHDQNFEEFLNKMESIMKKQKKNTDLVNKYISDMNKISFQSREPLREVLIYYQLHLSSNGFDPQVVSETLLFLGKLYQSRENFHRVYSDYTHWDFINSYRVYNIIEDFKFGLVNNNSFFNFDHIAKCVKGLRLAGYKNTKLVDLIFERILCDLTNTKMNKTYEKFSDVPGAGKYKFNASNLNAEDIFTNENFRKHVWKLMQMEFIEEEDTSSQMKNVVNIEPVKENKKEAKEKDLENEIMGPIKEIISLLRETKEIQHHFTDTIDNLLDQYYKIEQAYLENPEISNNPYIKYELFKLQDKLIEGGYLSLDTLTSINKKRLSPQELENIKIKNVITVLRDFVLINFPNLYNFGENKLDSLLEAENNYNQFSLNSSHYKVDLLCLGKLLAELTDYSKITNIDINGEDYYNDSIAKEFAGNIKNNKEHITVKPEYSKLYYNTEIFLKEIEPLVFNKLIDSNDIVALGYVYYAYSNMNMTSSKNLLNEILLKMTKIIKTENLKKLVIKNEDIQYFISGLAKGSANLQDKDLVNKIAQKIKYNELQSIEEMIKLLWGLSSFKLYSSDTFIQILLKLNENSEILNNYISNMKDFNMNLYQLSVCLKYEAVNHGVTIPNDLEFLADLHLNMREFSNIKRLYGETYNQLSILPKENLADPVRQTILNGFSEGFMSKEILKRFTTSMAKLETSDSSGKIPFFPDMVFTFYGHKIALFILGRDYITDETDVNLIPTNGWCNTTKRILHDKFNTHAIFIPTSQLIKFDVKTCNMDVIYSNQGFTYYLENLIAKQLNLGLETSNIYQIDKYLNSFVKKFSNSEVGDLIFNTEPRENLENFMSSLLSILDLHSDLIHISHVSLLEKKFTDLAILLEKNKLYFNEMSDNFQKYVNDILKEITNSDINYNIFFEQFKKSYETFLDKVIGNSSKAHSMMKSLKPNLVISDKWIGKRLFVDLIQNETRIEDKNMSVELLNNNFMWLGEYNSYEDWEDQLKSNYDNFNYFVENAKNKHLFNSHKLGNRNIPQGIFPHPHKFKQMKVPIVEKEIQAGSSYEYELKQFSNMNETLIKQEISKNVNLANTHKYINEDLALKVNLLNIKNSLKQNLKDNEILKFIANFDFIDKLIDEHLNDVNSNPGELLKRDAVVFMNFYRKQAVASKEYDEYDQFIMKEYYNNQKIFEIDSKLSPEENMKRIEERMAKKLEMNEDGDSISVVNPNIVDYNFDIKSILSSARLLELDADCEKEVYQNNPELFVARKRRIAERNLILLNIVVKLLEPSNDFTALNEKEQKYLQYLMERISKTNINNITEVGIKNQITNLKFEDLTANDTYALNALYNVDINENSNSYSLSELILELSHFIDSSTINKIIHQLYEQSVINKGEAKSSTAFPVENKEPELITREIKETLWRLSGFFNEEDKSKLLKMLSVKRGKSHFDKIWLNIDTNSLLDFLKTANTYEDRIKFLGKWIRKKEKEIETRIKLPPDNLAISDTKINNLIEKKDKAYRKTLLFNIFKVDNLNKIDSKSVSEFITKFCSSLYMFNFKYPQNIKDIFNALEDVPSLYEEDRQLLKTYRLFFNIDQNNPFEFLSVNPIKMETEKIYVNAENFEEYFNEQLLKRLENASIPFIPYVVEKILKINHK